MRLLAEDESERLDRLEQARQGRRDALPLLRLLIVHSLNTCLPDSDRTLAPPPQSEICLEVRISISRTPGPNRVLKPQQSSNQRYVFVHRCQCGQLTRGPETLLRKNAFRPASTRPALCIYSRTDVHPVSRQALRLQSFLIEIVFVDPFDLMEYACSYTDSVLDHQTCEFPTIDQDDPLRTPLHIILRSLRKASRADEHALGRPRSINRTSKVTQVTLTHRMVIGIPLALNIDFVQTKRVFPDRTVDAAISGSSGYATHCVIAATKAHRNQQIDDSLFQKCRIGPANPFQHFGLQQGAQFAGGTVKRFFGCLRRFIRRLIGGLPVFRRSPLLMIPLDKSRILPKHVSVDASRRFRQQTLTLGQQSVHPAPGSLQEAGTLHIHNSPTDPV